ncbi:DUF6395 domain-containing protein [Pelagibius sp. Alg239-R121]|uniref:DUF6395 domain-containing protein n=1 Tax=Pelagibius sp. Alg239-R121 TaxID=2993448 RepID=UPI0024A6ECF0|nr:DUF6395 domain-containing protein [Pelagibius sp. Alg239-R121]
MRLENLTDPERSDVEIFFDLVSQKNVPEPVVLDGFVMGILFYAMRTEQDIHVHGAMSVSALRNLNEFQEAWRLWKQPLYRKIKIIPERSVEQTHLPLKNDAIAAFSGGVDSTFTLLRHTGDRLGTGSYGLKKSVLMVHGFDVPLNNSSQLDALVERTTPLLDELGVDVRIIRTNLKEVDLQIWEDSFLSQLACCMHNYAHEFGFGLAGSSEPYDALLLPWGSNPATDYLLSGDGFRVVHDGAGYSRTQKVEEIARHATAERVVKVCWEGKETHKNCGSCEKCIRTRLNFLAVGSENPPCFDTPLKVDQIKGVRFRSNVHCMEMESVIRYAKEKGRKGAWLDAIERAVFLYKIKRPYRDTAQIVKPKLRNGFRLILNGDWQLLFDKIRKNAKQLLAHS